MKKRIIPKTAALAMAAALALPVTVCAAPPAAAPIEMSVKQDGKTHRVFVFGQSLALVSTDGSIEISCMGPVGRVDVMIDGVLTKNVASIDIPASQETKMVLDENSIIVKNVTAESGAAVKKQISDAYASGTASVDLASLAGVTAYKVNADGQVEDASGRAVSANAIGMSVSSTEAASASFTEEIREMEIAEQAAAAMEREASSETSEISSSIFVGSVTESTESGKDDTNTGTGDNGEESGGDEGDNDNQGNGNEEKEETKEQ